MKRKSLFHIPILGSVTAVCMTVIAMLILEINTAFAHVHGHDDHSTIQTTFSPRQIERLLANSTKPDFDARWLTPVLNYFEHTEMETDLTSRQRMFYARLLQHEHRFDEAQLQLEMLLEMNPLNTQARLLLANVALNQGQADKAILLCERLIGQTDLLVATTCLMEARMQQKPSEIHYAQLQKVTRFSERAPVQVQTWINEVLADMALYTDNPEEAIAYCERTKRSDWPVSTWVAWSKAKLQMNQGQEILTHLAPLIDKTAVPNDSMLLYLALAEQQVGGEHKWIKQMAQRVQLREVNQDTSHAAEVALYYLHLADEPAQALTWATINWDNAKSLNDQLLLDQAKAANQVARQSEHAD